MSRLDTDPQVLKVALRLGLNSWQAPAKEIINQKMHQAKAVEQWLVNHPRVTLLLLPTDCPQAHPIEQALGDVHECCTRHHQRKRLSALVADVEDHRHLNGPWLYQLSDLYDAPAITAAVEPITAEEYKNIAA